MNISVSPDASTMGAKSAKFVAHKILALVAQADAAHSTAPIRVIVATGASQFTFIEALVAIPNLPWDRVAFFHLDEYVGLDQGALHPASFRKYLNDRLFSKLSPAPAAIHLVYPDNIAKYEQALLEGDIDLACIGIGENGHVAFNDPPVADFNDPVLVKIVELDTACRQQQVGEGWFDSLDNRWVPRRLFVLFWLLLFLFSMCLAPFVFGRDSLNHFFFVFFFLLCRAWVPM
jgi:glucosamine-6-phosphate deaminase